MEAEKEATEKRGICSPLEEAPKVNMATSGAIFQDQSLDGDISVKVQAEVNLIQGQPLVNHREHSTKTLFDEETITFEDPFGNDDPVVYTSLENDLWEPEKIFTSVEELNGRVCKSFSLDEIFKNCSSNVSLCESEENSAMENTTSQRMKRRQQHLAKDQQEGGLEHWEENSQRQLREPLPQERQPEHLHNLQQLRQDEKLEIQNKEQVHAKGAFMESRESGDDNCNEVRPGSRQVVGWADEEDWWDSTRIRPLVTPPSPLSTASSSSSSSSSSCLRAPLSPLTALIKGRRIHRTATGSTKKGRDNYQDQNIDRCRQSSDSLDSRAIPINPSAVSHASSKSPLSPPLNTLPSVPCKDQTKQVASDSIVSSDSSHKHARDNPERLSQQTDPERFLPGFESGHQPDHERKASSTVNKASTKYGDGFSLHDEMPLPALPEASLPKSASAAETTSSRSQPVTPRLSRSKVEEFPRDTSCNQKLVFQQGGISRYAPRFPIFGRTLSKTDQKKRASIDKDAAVALCKNVQGKGPGKLEDVVNTDDKKTHHRRRSRSASERGLPCELVGDSQGVTPNDYAPSTEMLGLQKGTAFVRRRHASWPSSPVVSQADDHQCPESAVWRPPALTNPDPQAPRLDDVQVRGDGERICESQIPYHQLGSPLRRRNWLEEQNASEDILDSSYQAPPPSPTSNQWSPHVSPPFLRFPYYSNNTPIHRRKLSIDAEKSQRSKNFRVLWSPIPHTSRGNTAKSRISVVGLDNEASCSHQETSTQNQEGMIREKITYRSMCAIQTNRHELKRNNVPLFRNNKPPATSKTVEQSSKNEKLESCMHYSLYGPKDNASLMERINLKQTPKPKDLSRRRIQNGIKVESHLGKNSQWKTQLQTSTYTQQVKARMRTASSFEKVEPHIIEQIMTRENCPLTAGDGHRVDCDRSAYRLPNECLRCKKANAQQAPRRRPRNTTGSNKAVSTGGATLREKTAPVRPPSAKPRLALGRTKGRRGSSGQHEDAGIMPPTPSLWKDPDPEGTYPTLTPWQQDSETTLIGTCRSKSNTSSALKSCPEVDENTGELSCISRKPNVTEETTRLEKKDKEQEPHNAKQSSKEAILSIKRLLVSMDEKRQKARERSRTTFDEKVRRNQRKTGKLGETPMVIARVVKDEDRRKGVGRKTWNSRPSSKSRELPSKREAARTKEKSLKTSFPRAHIVEKASNLETHPEPSDNVKLSKPLHQETVAKRQENDLQMPSSGHRSKTQRWKTESIINDPDILQLAGRLSNFLKYASRTKGNVSRKTDKNRGRRSGYSKHVCMYENESQTFPQPTVRDKSRQRKRRRDKRKKWRAKNSTSLTSQLQTTKGTSETTTELNDSADSIRLPAPLHELPVPLCQESNENVESTSCMITDTDALESSHETEYQRTSATPDGASARKTKGCNKETADESKRSFVRITSGSCKSSANGTLPAATDTNTHTIKVIDRSPLPNKPALNDSPEQEEIAQISMTKMGRGLERKKKKKKKPKEKEIETAAMENPCEKDANAHTDSKKEAVKDVATEEMVSHRRGVNLEDRDTHARHHVGRKLQGKKRTREVEAKEIYRFRFSNETSAESIDGSESNRFSLSSAFVTISPSSPDADLKSTSIPQNISGYSLEDADFWSSLLKAREGKRVQTKRITSSEALSQLSKAKGDPAPLLTATNGKQRIWSSSMIPNSKARPLLLRDKTKPLSQIRVRWLSKATDLASTPLSEKPARMMGSGVTRKCDLNPRFGAKTSTEEDDGRKAESEKEGGDCKDKGKTREKRLDLADLISAGVFSLDHLCQLHPELSRLVPGGLVMHPLLLPSQQCMHAIRERLPCTKRLCSCNKGKGTQQLPGIQG